MKLNLAKNYTFINTAGVDDDANFTEKEADKLETSKVCLKKISLLKILRVGKLFVGY